MARRVSHTTWMTISGVIYIAFMGSLLLVVGSLPLIFLLLFTDLAQTWLLATVAWILAAPSLTALFTVFARFSGEGDTTVVRTFLRAWRTTWKRATAFGAITGVAVALLAIDIRVVWGQQIGAVAIPVFATFIAIVLATALLGFTAIADVPTVRLRDLVKACPYLALRRWYLTLASFFVLTVLTMFIAAKPGWALGLATAPLLYVVWANSRNALRPVLQPAPAAQH